MRSLIISLVLATASSAFANNLVTFSDISVPAGGFNNGGPISNSTGFLSGNTLFNNTYNSAFGGYWNGFSISNVNDAATAGFGNQYASYTGTGFGGAGNYAIAYPTAFINVPPGEKPTNVQLTNTTYTALSMKNGDSFAKKFGGPTGNDPDFLSVTLTGYDSANAAGTPTGSATLFLADYRFADNTQDYILNQWTSLDLAPLGSARSIGISFASSDVGTFGINTPTYVALDNLTTVPEPVATSLLALAFVGRRNKR